jgi:hypothetical protein
VKKVKKTRPPPIQIPTGDADAATRNPIFIRDPSNILFKLNANNNYHGDSDSDSTDPECGFRTPPPPPEHIIATAREAEAARLLNTPTVEPISPVNPGPIFTPTILRSYRPDSYFDDQQPLYPTTGNPGPIFPEPDRNRFNHITAAMVHEVAAPSVGVADPVNLFCYSIDMIPSYMTHLVPGAEYKGLGRVQNMKWFIGESGRPMIIAAGADDVIYGMVYGIDKATLEQHQPVMAKLGMQLLEIKVEMNVAEDNHWGPAKEENQGGSELMCMSAWVAVSEKEGELTSESMIKDLQRAVIEGLAEGMPDSFVEGVLRKYIPYPKPYEEGPYWMKPKFEEKKKKTATKPKTTAAKGKKASSKGKKGARKVKKGSLKEAAKKELEVSEEALEKVLEKEVEEALKESEKGSEVVSEKSLEKSAGKSSEETAEKACEKESEEAPEGSSEKSPEKSSEEKPEKVSEKSSEETFDKEPDKPSESSSGEKSMNEPSEEK